MSKKLKGKGATVLLDVELTIELNRVREKVIARLNEAGLNGLANAPSVASLARMALRQSLGLETDLNDYFRP